MNKPLHKVMTAPPSTKAQIVDVGFAHKALGNLGMVAYLSTTLNTGHAWGCGRETLVLPVRAK